MKRTSYVFVVATLLAATLALACGTSQPTQDGGVTFGNPIFADYPKPAPFTPYQPSQWHPTTDGSAENRNTPPNECDCAPGYTPHWNGEDGPGQNWVCKGVLGVEFPAKDDFCNLPH